jgi:putative ABC transport system permease protein
MRLWRRRRDEDFRREVDAHLALEAEDLMGDGMDPDEARTAARRAFGNTARVQEQFYESRRILWLDAMWRDGGDTLRGIRRNPGFAGLVIMTLAFGIGANTAIFSVIHAVLLRPFPYDGADRIVRIYEDAPGAPDGGMRPIGLTKDELDTLRSSSRTLSHAGIYLPSTMTLSGSGEAARLTGMQISPALIAMFRVRPAIGRLFGPREDAPMDRVVILSDRSWQRRFASDPDVVGRAVLLDGNPYTVIGVMPRGFSFPDAETEYWIPFVFPPRARLVVTARVKDGVTREAAAREIGEVLGRVRRASPYPAPPPPPPPPPPRADGRPRTLEEVLAMSPPVPPPVQRQIARPQPPEPPRIRLLGFQDFVIGSHRRALAMLAAAVGFVLLIACANVANLLLARGAARQHEFVVRLAIGASRGRLMRQLLTESTLLACAGGVIGSALAVGAVHVFRGLGAALPRAAFGPGFGIPRLDEVTIDTSALAFTAVVAVLAGIVAGIVPAFRHSTIRRLDGQLRTANGSTESGWRWSRGARLRPFLVVLELALATVLFISASLMVRSFINLAAVHPGYDAAGVVTFQVIAPSAREMSDVRDALRERLASAPGVEGVAFADQLPMSGRRGSVHLRKTPDAAGGPPPPPAPGGSGPPQFPSLRIVSPNFTSVMRMRMVEGRELRESDGAGSPAVMLINQTLARSGYLGPHPVGTEIYAMGSRRWQIVGIVEDMRQSGLDQEPGPEVFVAPQQLALPAAGASVSPFFIVRTAVNPGSAVPGIRAAIARYDPQLALDRVTTMEDIISNTLVRPKFFTTLLGVFAAVSVVLALTGIYGVLSFMVRQRSREIGIRMSLGATPAAILGLVLREGALLSAAGVVLGLGASMILTRSLSSQLFGVTPLDLSTYLGVAMSFGLVSALASYVPAKRAARVDPLVALRYE